MGLNYYSGLPDYFGNNIGAVGRNALQNTSVKTNAQLGADVPGFLRADTPKVNPGGTGTSWFGKGGYLDTGANVAQGLAGAMGAYTGWEALNLSKDQFGFEKAATNRNLANQGKMINNEYENRAAVSMALAGNTMTPEEKSAYMEKAKAKYVDTSAIG